MTDWCADCLPDEDRERRRIAFTSVGDTLTILDRRPPAFPELGAVWSSTPLARLCADPDGRWTLFLPTVGGERWERQEPTADDPLDLLGPIAEAVRGAA
uniref:DUF3024 domain-containing protein n=1 Tax=Pseudonocardia pini TaxID=2758030 RepID=UPI0015F0C3FA|nr:hypothetical protein [Pseudonocardia pini]